jgi:hypothetical protein
VTDQLYSGSSPDGDPGFESLQKLGISGPAAAAVAYLCLNERSSVAGALELLRRAGTDPHYTGLYAAPKDIRRPTPEELDRLPSDFPAVSQVAALAQVMVGVDERWEHLKQVRAAGWKVPVDHPDLDPAHEALQLAEHYREAARLPEVKKRPEDFIHRLAEAEAGAKELERILRKGKDKGGVNAAMADEAYRRAGAACVSCHARYRDVPKGP